MSHAVETEAAAAELISRAHELVPSVREWAAEGEEQRSLTTESFDALIRAGFARAGAPARFGGLELDWTNNLEAIRIIATGDASHGWCAGLLTEMAHFCGYFHPDAQSALWADGPDVAIASSVLPAATFEPDGDGYRISGHSPFASGVNHAQWSLIAGFIQRASGPEWNLALVPATDYEIEDTWATVGMRGTGSNTIVTDGAYVPGTHVVSMSDLRDGNGPGSRWHDTHLYRIPWACFGPLSFLAPTLGATQGAFEAFSDWTRTRMTKAGTAMADLPTVQVTMATAAADIDAAELLLRRAAETTLVSQPTLDQRARSMRDFAYSRVRLLEAIDAVMQMSGSAGFSESNAIQRAWRDVHLMTTHISMNDANFTHWARHELGLGLLPNQLLY